MSIRSKKDLELELSKLKSFTNPSVKLEQYPTPANIAADWSWSMAMNSEAAGKNILDAACGTGIIGIGLLLMGAKKIFFLDTDKQTLDICAENYTKVKKEFNIGEAEFIHQDISLFNGDVDIIVQNPPFGTKEEHADKRFLEKAFSTTPIIYSMHKFSTAKFVEAIAKDFGFKITHLWRYEFPVKAMFKFHEKPVKFIDVGLWRMEKRNKANSSNASEIFVFV